MEKKRRNRFKQALPLGERLIQEANNLRKQAQGLPRGSQRERLIRHARECDDAADLNEWLASSGPRTPS